MKVILFGATGMVGQGVLRECLLDPGVEQVLTVGRNATGQQHPKLRELAHKELTGFSTVEKELTGYDTCFFCLGVSAAGMSEQDYRAVTYDIALAAGRSLARLNPGMTFIYVSGEGTDSTGKAFSMWARVKGETENALLKLPFKAAYMFRPGYIQPLHGIVSRTGLYRTTYRFLGWLYPVLRVLFRKHVTTTEQVGRAMLQVARQGATKRVLETPDINAAAQAATASLPAAS
ncbi:epimerase [Archangium sp.]|uniref:epimerase n=1 Tax=Archangium sp. TaxID=1872627 RepID=UPI00389A168A